MCIFVSDIDNCGLCKIVGGGDGENYYYVGRVALLFVALANVVSLFIYAAILFHTCGKRENE